MAAEPIGRRIAPRLDALASFFARGKGKPSRDPSPCRPPALRGWRSKETTTMSTVQRLVARNAVWLCAAMLLMVAACGEQGDGDEAEESPPGTTQQQ
jgi:hypothetical protein